MSPQTLRLEQASRFRNKTLAALLALFFGSLGAHGLYLGRRLWWLPLAYTMLMAAGVLVADTWWDNIFVHLLIVPVTAGILEAVILALRDPARFDAVYNPQGGGRNSHGWPSVLTAIAGAVAFVNISLYWLAIIVLALYRHLGWLDSWVY
ncbi:hypothetical protein [Alcaligenes sp. WGS1538]|uniref:hypothetical protein n=1 Tax=Alcaligenes sp. WGS1538 TaxID=3366811 RepID=UPI00372D1FF7